MSTYGEAQVVSIEVDVFGRALFVADVKHQKCRIGTVDIPWREGYVLGNHSVNHSVVAEGIGPLVAVTWVDNGQFAAREFQTLTLAPTPAKWSTWHRVSRVTSPTSVLHNALFGACDLSKLNRADWKIAFSAFRARERRVVVAVLLEYIYFGTSWEVLHADPNTVLVRDASACVRRGRCDDLTEYLVAGRHIKYGNGGDAW